MTVHRLSTAKIWLLRRVRPARGHNTNSPKYAYRNRKSQVCKAAAVNQQTTPHLGCIVSCYRQLPVILANPVIQLCCCICEYARYYFSEVVLYAWLIIVHGVVLNDDRKKLAWNFTNAFVKCGFSKSFSRYPNCVLLTDMESVVNLSPLFVCTVHLI